MTKPARPALISWPLRYQASRRVVRVNTVNLFLTVLQIAVGLVGHSQRWWPTVSTPSPT